MTETTARPPQARLAPLLAAEVISATGSALTAVSLPWFVLTSSGSATQAGLVVAAQMAPVVLFGVISGSWVEAIGARRWMMLADSCRALLVAAIPVLSMADALPFWLLLVLVAAIGLFSAPYTASQQILLSEVAGDDEEALSRATSTLQTATRVTLLLGPPAAGLLIAWIGARPVLFIDAASFLVILPLIGRLTLTSRRVDHRQRPRLLDGLKILFGDRLLASWTSGTVLGEAAYQALFIAFPILTVARYKESATLVGVLLGGFGLGAVLGSLFASRLTRRLSARRMAQVGKVLQAVTFLALIPAWPPSALVAIVTVLGLFNGMTNGPALAVRLTRIPPAMRSRALTASSTITMLGGTLGLVMAGPAMQSRPMTEVFTVMAVLQILNAGLFVWGARASAPAEPPVPAGHGNPQ